MEAVERLRSEGYTLLAIEQCEGSTMIQDFKALPGQKYAVVLGNEVKGVQQQVVDACDGCLEIPQFGTKHSMNVSVSAGIAIWSIVVQSLPDVPHAR
jgi:tRNA G18 (ribose-2'-O)-methylase SpoU